MRRVEGSLAGQLVLTALMAVLAAAVVVWNLPAGPAVAPLKPYAARVVQPLGLEQDWAVFAPQPRGFSVGAYAVVHRADGSRTTWRPPSGGALLAPYRDYRWQKYVERLRGDDQRALWDDAARFAAREVAGDGGSAPVRVELVRTFRESVPVGTGEPRRPEQVFVFHELVLR